MSNEENRQSKIDVAKRNLIKTAQKYKSVFGSPEGQQVLLDLTVQFNPDYICNKGTPQSDIVVQAAQRDVIEHINRNIRIAERNFE